MLYLQVPGLYFDKIVVPAPLHNHCKLSKECRTKTEFFVRRETIVLVVDQLIYKPEPGIVPGI
jgi:hypothetical protein